MYWIYKKKTVNIKVPRNQETKYNFSMTYARDNGHSFLIIHEMYVYV